MASPDGRIPDRRQVSKRWLVSAVLVGMTSVFLMGGALFAALDGRQQLALPAQAYEKADSNGDEAGIALRGNHPGLIANAKQSTSSVMMVSTVTKVGSENVVKVRPFLNIKAPMARVPAAQFDYPAFNPLAVFSESGKAEPIATSSDLIYGADVESEVKLKVVDFPFGHASATHKQRQNATDIEEQVRRVAASLNAGYASISALSYIDAERFSLEDQPFLATPGVTITAENVSVLGKQNPNQIQGLHYQERMIPIRAEASISTIFETEGLDKQEASRVETVLASDLGSPQLNAGDRLHVFYEIDKQRSNDTGPVVVRVSVYRGTAHLVSIARTDKGQFVYALEPEKIDEEEIEEAPLLASSRLPSIYDAIYRAGLSEGLSVDLANALIRIFAFDVDFKSKVSFQDDLSAFVSLEDGEEKPTAESEILFASITLGGLKRRYYRFRDEVTGHVDYYDETGKSAKKFLLRQPVPNGRFRSPFGKRWHPILKYKKMHWGVDWSAPRGTPILAAGNGIIKEAKRAGGSGKRTIIRHANGYETYYLHQTAFAKGIKPGVRVRQGQLIGYVGSTGLSTGPHLHYEVSVNKNKVDPMRIRLPKGKVLKDEELAAFEAERDRIDALVDQGEEEPTKIASN